MRPGALAVMLGVLAGPALAADPPMPRCSLLGQIAMSSWLEMMGTLSGSAGDLDPVAARLNDIVGLYDSVGCDTARLGAAMDCLLEETGGATARDTARTCLVRSGLATED